MKFSTIRGMTWIVLSILILWGFCPAKALASDGFQFTRAHYDLIMRYLNFIILASVIIKFGRKPIMNFLHNQKNEVATSIARLETLKQEAQTRIKQSQEHLAASQQRLAEISQRIKADGMQRKQEIIEQAQSESTLMLEAARLKIEGNIRNAFLGLKVELVDASAEMAAEKMPSLLRSEDHERLLQQWMEAAEQQLP